MKTLPGLLLPLCALGFSVQHKFLSPDVYHIGSSSASHITERNQQTLALLAVVESYGVLSYEVLVSIELLVVIAVYVFIGVSTATYVSDAFHCSWTLAMLINMFIWPITTIVAGVVLAFQRLSEYLSKLRSSAANKSEKVKLDHFLSIVNHGTPQFCAAKLTEKFGAMETVTPKSLAEKLQMPEAKAVRWHKWLARGNPELSLNMLLCRAAELHKADGKKICRILFEIYDENDDGVLPRSEAKEVLQNWCLGKYGTTCLKNMGMEQVIETLMGQMTFSGGDINKIEWMRLADKCPEFFETEPQYPEHVRYLRLLCRVRMEQNGHVMRLAAK